MELYPFKRHSCKLGPMQITYAAEGDPAHTPVLFLHNGGGDHRCWYYQLKLLPEKKYYCVAIDLPGFGESTRPDVAYTVETLSNLVLPFIEKHFDRPIHLVGHCIGAATALDLTLKNPALVEKLVLVNLCAGGKGMSGVTRIFFKWVPQNPTLFRLYASFIVWMSRTKIALKTSLNQLFTNPDSNPNNLCISFEKDICQHPLQPLSRKNLIRGMRSFTKFAVPFSKDALKGKPIFILWGEKNKVMSLKIGGFLSRYLGAPLHVMPSLTHMIMSDAPDEFNRLIDQFMQAPSSSPNSLTQSNGNLPQP